MTLKYTLVQHSGAGYGGKPGFARAVETRTVRDGRIQNAIKNRGGVLFDSYAKAADAEDQINGVNGGPFLMAAGNFDSYKIDDLRLYIPAPGELNTVS